MRDPLAFSGLKHRDLAKNEWSFDALSKMLLSIAQHVSEHCEVLPELRMIYFWELRCDN